jgi:molybdenum cofactor synthesis domain-containing protein
MPPPKKLAPETPVTACVLVIGNEILSGRTKDANLPWLAEQLNAIGIQVREARVVPDVAEAIVATVNEVRAKYDYVFTTGGIGPTHDDITAECMAKAFGVRLIRHAEAVARLQSHYANPADLNQARLRMANVPEGASLIDNPVSKAPGFRIGNVYVMAGVPRIMQAMFDGLKHDLKGGRSMLSRTVTSTVPEGTIAGGLGEIQARYPGVEIGSYPYFRLGKFGTSIVLRGFEAGPLDQAAEEVRVLMRELGGVPVDGDIPAEPSDTE